MSTGNPLAHPFNVYTMQNGERVTHVAGAQDAASAIVLAGAVFVAAQSQSAEIPLLVVYDSADAAWAFIGETERVT